MIFNQSYLFHSVKLVTCVQLGVMTVSFFLFYLLRVGFKMNDRRLNKKIEKMRNLLTSLTHHDIELSPQRIPFFKKNLRELLVCMKEIENSPLPSSGWIHLRQQLSDKVLKPQARRLATSSTWLKQYLAILSYEYGIGVEDESILSQLIRSDTFIVSLNTARIIFKYPTPETTNALIDSLAQGRRIQQSLYAEILTSEDTHDVLINTLVGRLAQEHDPYIKTFCYRLLARLAPSNDAIASIETDSLSDNLDLKIAALHYLSCFQNAMTRPMLRRFLDDEQPEVKAVVAKLMGEIHDEESVPFLEKKLHDSAWWVRINAAKSLSQLGKKGIFALQQQSFEVDRFAYEAAQKVLITLKNASPES